MPPHPPFAILARSLAQGAQTSDLLLELHRETLAATGGVRSVILQRGSRSGDFTATSGRGFEALGGPWLQGPWAAALARLSDIDEPTLSKLDDLAPLRERLDAATALIISLTPCTGHEPATFLIITDPSVPPERALEFGARARVEFSLALELARLGREGAMHRRIQELLLGFSRGISSTLSVGGALESLTADTNVLFGTRRTSVWLHDRRNRELVLSASSDPAYAATAERVATDADATASRGLRLDRPELAAVGLEELVLIAPLRGWRRALGTLVVEGDPADLDDRQFLDAAYDLARQLSVALENVQLLEGVLQQRRLLEDTFNSLIELVAVIDNSSRVVQLNEAFAERAGRPIAELREQPVADLVGPEMAEWLAAAEPESPAPTADGSQPPAATRAKQFTDDRLGGIFAATVTPLINQDGEPVGHVLVARDITEQTRLEREREALSQRLAQSEKLASLGQFVAGIAHEINNPLQGVLGHLELLISAPDTARPVRPTLRRIYQEGERAAKIVRNLLVFTGSRRMTRRRVRVERVIGRAIASRAATLKHARIEVVRQDAERIPPIAGDALLLQQALLNVLINAEHAIVATGQPGRIEIGIAPTRDEKAVRVTIRDTGGGIQSDILARIFDPFFTTKEVGQGTGLGLAITYGIVQEHGGTIQAANGSGGGAQFTIELPASSQ